MRYLLNAFSPTMLKSPDKSTVVFRTLNVLSGAEAVFAHIMEEGINALNPRHAALFEALRAWGATTPPMALSVELDIGDDALIILPKNQNRAGAEVQTQTPADYTYMWCGVVASNGASVQPQALLYEYSCGRFSNQQSIENLAPTDLIMIAYGLEFDVGGVAITHRTPIVAYRGMLR